ncbi:serine hydrolase [Wenzhouxiangella sp. XN201]|uniref:serine hydrolase n=1 Tax=Wenzhouxiangella sp. XN201 TaxID=2710755 RepID=UPI0013CC5B81|nr:serine hydrolase [Wenzhouxiangella sp. XN201]NEZ04970.1 serine hydrolase [Wenzhouxiangella sp. XN201]
MRASSPFSIVWLLAAIGMAAAGPALAEPDAAAIDAVVERAMDTFGSPGLTVSVVHDGELVYAQGRGILEVGGDVAVDADTLFQIASVSKAFTAAALALLADDGKLSFDDRVIDHLPEFRMHDPYVTREFRIRDLLTHRSGLPLGAGDLLMFPQGKTTREEILRAMRHFEPSSSFRAQYDYDNSMYIIAGMVVEEAAGQSFESFLEERLLFPLGMNDCAATFDRAPESLPKAVPHVEVDGEIETTPTGLLGDTAAPAGGITCSARSMARWMNFILDEGVSADGDRLISEQQFAELFSPVTITRTPGYLSEHAGASLSAYALGWNVSTFHGQPLHSHGGGLMGMTSHLMLLPRENLGVFVSNNLMSAAPRPVAYDIAEMFMKDLADNDPDWIAVVEELMQQRRDSGAEAVEKAMAERDADSSPSLPLEAYAGIYRDPWYGEITLSLEDDGRLWFRSPRSEPLTGPLEHFQFDTFIVRWTDRRLNADAYMSFILDPQGEVESARMKAVSPTTDFSFDFHDLDLRRVKKPAEDQ